MVNCTKVTNTQIRDYTVQLPGDMITDLRLAFAFYEKDSTNPGYISIPHFKNILHNFGFNKMGVREINDELRKSDTDFLKRNFVDLEFIIHVVAYRWFSGKNKESGMEEEAKDCFKLFDRRDRNFITAAEIRNVLQTHIKDY